MATGDPELAALHQELSSYGDQDGLVHDADTAESDPADVALPIRLRHGRTELSFFNTITTFGAAFDLTLDEIAVEAYFPADDATAEYLRAGCAVESVE
ncbi:MmyB family transcriptional regulator [Nocardia uniformis]|uniref:MmyB family transcriptional regulator n=1 Tax=Nocardia uniformis TaxID=53432 RepID=UPI0027D8579A|nr:hypothetical protein [Nocardia uniformis]